MPGTKIPFYLRGEQNLWHGTFVLGDLFLTNICSHAFVCLYIYIGPCLNTGKPIVHSEGCFGGGGSLH